MKCFWIGSPVAETNRCHCPVRNPLICGQGRALALDYVPVMEQYPTNTRCAILALLIVAEMDSSVL
jgi:hypothetical protein